MPTEEQMTVNGITSLGVVRSQRMTFHTIMTVAHFCGYEWEYVMIMVFTRKFLLPPHPGL